VVLQDGMTSTSFVSSQGWQVDWPQLQLLMGVYSGILTSSGLAARSLSARKRAFSWSPRERLLCTACTRYCSMG
jgi:hypothetical protein